MRSLSTAPTPPQGSSTQRLLQPLYAGDAYSLEEAKKKKEQDKLQAAADAKKQGVRAYVEDLRK